MRENYALRFPPAAANRGLPECRDVPYERQYYGAPGMQSGRVICLESPGGGVVWTDDDLAILTLAFPTPYGVNDSTVYRWWQEGTGGPHP
jgi:hypothetical protein